MDYTTITKKIVLFGVTTDSCAPVHYFLDMDFNNAPGVDCIIDNNAALHGMEIKGKRVHPVSVLSQYDAKDTIVIITTWSYHKEIIASLKDAGWSGEYKIAVDDDDFKILFAHYYTMKTQVKEEILPNGSVVYSPTHLQIELSGLCNCACLYCPYHGVAKRAHNKKLIHWDVLKRMTEQVQAISSIHALHAVGEGETMLHPEWFEMLSYLLEKTQIPNLIIYTNGMLLNESNVDKLSRLPCKKVQLDISIDGNSPRENDMYRVHSIYDVIKKNLDYANRVIDQNKITFVIANCRTLSRSYFTEHDGVIGRIDPPEFLLRDFSYATIGSTTIAAVDTAISISDDTVWEKAVKGTGSPLTYCHNPLNMLALDNCGNVLRCPCSAAYLGIIGNIDTVNMLSAWRYDEKMQELRNAMIQMQYHDMCGLCPRTPSQEFYALVRKN